MFITNSPAPSRINSAELPQRDVTVWEFAIFGYFPCIIRTVRTRSFNHKHKHRKMGIFCHFFSRFFLFLELGIFLFKLGKKHTFWHWEHDRISVVKTGQKNPALPPFIAPTKIVIRQIRTAFPEFFICVSIITYFWFKCVCKCLFAYMVSTSLIIQSCCGLLIFSCNGI